MVNHKKQSPEGLLDGSCVYFHQPGLKAYKTFFYPLCTGHFFCDSSYEVNRNSYDSFLVMLLKKGTGYISSSHFSANLKAGDAVFLDCYEPHRYGTKEGFEILWVHIDGPMCRAYHNLFLERSRSHVSLSDKSTYQSLEAPLQYLFHTFSHALPCSEVYLSKLITDILTALLHSNDTVQLYQPSLHWQNDGSVSDKIKLYLRQHFTEPVTVQELSAHTALSPYYMIRCFKKETSLTPHHYLTQLRLQSARFYLKTTALSVKEIGFKCGFQSENSFCIAFRKETGTTPTKYRLNEPDVYP